MTKRTKKTAYITIAVIGVLSFAWIMLGATYDTAFLGRSDQGVSITTDTPVVTANAQTVPDQSVSAISQTQQAAVQAVEPQATASLPRISIPSIGVDAHIETVGINGKGNIGTPSKLYDVGWYKDGASIGAPGVAIVDGHVENLLLTPGVFYNLHKVAAGADVYVTDKAGSNIHFVVTDIQDYDLATAPVQEIYNDTSGAAILRLITCRKTLANGKYAYNHRIVVTAKLVSA